MPANYFNGKIQLKGIPSLSKNAYFYMTSDGATKAPFNVSVTNGNKYVNYSNFGASGAVLNNEDSYMWMVKNGSFQGRFKTVLNDVITSWHKCIELKNGNYYAARYDGSSSYDLMAFRSDGQQLSNTIRSLNPSVVANACIMALDDGTDVFPVLMFQLSSGFVVIESLGTLISNFNWLSNSVLVGDDPYVTAPESEADGGFGDFDYTSDIIALPTAPSISISESGFVTLYKPTLAQLQALAAYMWSGLFDINTFRKIFADPMDCIISLALIPLDPTASGSQELKVGNIGTGLTIDKLASQFVEVSFDPLNIGLRANNFMDYSPYTKVQIYLPFIGTRSLSIDDVAGKNITLKYVIDIFTGACNASIGVEVEGRDNQKHTTTLYQFTGNILANVPITANNFASFLQATVGAVSTAVGVATGAGALAGVASAINAAQSMKPDIEKSGNLSSTAGFLGVQKPFLILTYPNLCRPEGRDKVTGTPSFIGLRDNPNNLYPLSKFHGYTQLHRVNVKNITCTETERQMILSQLTGEGVILP